MDSAVTVYHAGTTSASSDSANSSSGGMSASGGGVDSSNISVFNRPSTPTYDPITTTRSTNTPNTISVTSGGRVLAVTGTGSTLRNAVQAAYQGVQVVHFEGMQYRTDIAKR